MASPASRFALPTALLALLLLTGCSDGVARGGPASSAPTVQGRPGEGRSVVVGSAAPCVPPSAIPVGDVATKLPHGVSLPAGSRVLQVDVADGLTTVVGESRLGITPLQALFRAQLQAAGREIFSEDNEGREAELYFTLPGGRFGVVRQNRARCPVGVTRFSISS